MLAEFKDPVYDQSGISLITSSVRRHAPDSLDPKIHHNNLLTSILAKIEANVAGADDAVMLDNRGFIAETNATHLFMVLDGGAGLTLATPTTAACPEGITRATVLRLAAAAGIPLREGTTPFRSFTTRPRSSSPARWAASPRWCPSTGAQSATAPSARSPSS